MRRVRPFHSPTGSLAWNQKIFMNFAHLIEILLQIDKLASGSVLKVHTLAFIGQGCYCQLLQS